MSQTNALSVTQAACKKIDDVMERITGLDNRLIYGFAVPVLVMSLLICVMMLIHTTVVMLICYALEAGALFVVIAGFLNVLDDPRDAEEQ